MNCHFQVDVQADLGGEAADDANARVHGEVHVVDDQLANGDRPDPDVTDAMLDRHGVLNVYFRNLDLHCSPSLRL